MITSVIGRKIRPVCSGERYSTCCRYSELTNHIGNSDALNSSTMLFAIRSGLVSSLKGISGSEARRTSITTNTTSSAIADEDRAERGERAQAGEARFDDPEHEHHLADRQRQRAGEVEAAPRRAAALAHDRVGDDRRRDPDRGVDQQHPAPVELLGDDPPEQHPRGAAEAVHRRPRADRAVQLRAGRERGGDDRQRARRHQRAAEALDRARDDERHAVRCEAAGERGEREQRAAPARTSAAARSGRRRGRRTSRSRRT